jgi:hypothetical protein
MHLLIISIKSVLSRKTLHARCTLKCIYDVLSFHYKDFAEKVFWE